MAFLERNKVNKAGANPFDSSFSLHHQLDACSRLTAPVVIVHRFIGTKDCYTWTSLIHLDRLQSIGAPVAVWSPEKKQFEAVTNCNDCEYEQIRIFNHQLSLKNGQPALKVVA